MMETKKLSEREIVDLVKNYLKRHPSEQESLITKIENLNIDSELDAEIEQWAEGAG